MSIWVSLTDNSVEEVSSIWVPFTDTNVCAVKVFVNQNNCLNQVWPGTRPCVSYSVVPGNYNEPAGVNILASWDQPIDCLCVYTRWQCGHSCRYYSSSSSFSVLQDSGRYGAYLCCLCVSVYNTGISSSLLDGYKWHGLCKRCIRIRHAFLCSLTCCAHLCLSSSYETNPYCIDGCIIFCGGYSDPFYASKGTLFELKNNRGRVCYCCNCRGACSYFEYHLCFKCLNGCAGYLKITPKTELGNSPSCCVCINKVDLQPLCDLQFICWTGIGGSSNLCLCDRCWDYVDGYQIQLGYMVNPINSYVYESFYHYSINANNNCSKVKVRFNSGVSNKCAYYFTRLNVRSFKCVFNVKYFSNWLSLNICGLPLRATPQFREIGAHYYPTGSHNQATTVGFVKIYATNVSYYRDLCFIFENSVIKRNKGLLSKPANSFVTYSGSVSGYASKVQIKGVLCNCYQKYFNCHKFKYNSTAFTLNINCTFHPRYV